MKSSRMRILCLLLAVILVLNGVVPAIAAERKVYAANIYGRDHFETLYIPVTEPRTPADIRQDMMVDSSYLLRIPGLAESDPNYWMRMYYNDGDPSRFIATGQDYDIGFAFTAPETGTYEIDLKGNCPAYVGDPSSDGVRVLVYLDGFGGAFVDELVTKEQAEIGGKVFMEAGQKLYFLFNKNGTTYNDGIYIDCLNVYYDSDKQDDSFAHINWGFEDGTVAPFRALNGVEGRQTVAERDDVGKTGKYYLSTLDLADGNEDVSWTGSFISEGFYVNSETITLKLAGGAENVVSLHRSSDNAQLASVRLSKSAHVMETVTLTVPQSVRGVYEEVYLKITDNASTGAFGYVYADDIAFSGLMVADELYWSFEEGNEYPFEMESSSGTDALPEKPDEDHYETVSGPVLWDFEDGYNNVFSFDGNNPTMGFIGSSDQAEAKGGTYYLSTIDSTGDPNYWNEAWTGTLTSIPFYVDGPTVSMKIGGGTNGTYVALCDAVTGQELVTTAKVYAGHHFEAEGDHTMTVPAAYVGTDKAVVLKVVDTQQAGWAFIYVDDIAFTGRLLEPLAEKVTWDFEGGYNNVFTSDNGGAGFVGNTADAAGKGGTYFLSTLDSAGGPNLWDEAWTGNLTSVPFTVENARISMKVGGGNNGTYVALCDAETGQELATSAKVYAGHWFEDENTHTLTVPAAYVGTGKQLVLKVVDTQSAGWAFIYVDDISFVGHVLKELPEKITWDFEGGYNNVFTSNNGGSGFIGNSADAASKGGTYYLSTIDSAGAPGAWNEAWTGTLTSVPFYIDSASIAMKVGGGTNGTYVALCDAVTGAELVTTAKVYAGHHFESELESNHTMTVPAEYVGTDKAVVLKVIDTAEAGWAFIYVDDISFMGRLLEPLPEKITWDFENGLDGTFAPENAADAGRGFIGNSADAAAKGGEKYLSTIDLDGIWVEAWTGKLVSVPFYAAGSTVSMKIGGGVNGTYVALCDAVTGQELVTTAKVYPGHHFEAEGDHTITIPAEYVGTKKALVLKVVDTQESNWAFIYVDDISFVGVIAEQPKEDKPASEDILWDFESGTNEFFTPDAETTMGFIGSSDQAEAKGGTYYLSTIDSNGDPAAWNEIWTGTLTSVPFYIDGPTVAMKIGGGTNGAYVALCDAFTGEELGRTAKVYAGHYFEMEGDHTITVPAEYIGTDKAVVLKVVDTQESNWAFIYVDDIAFRGRIKTAQEGDAFTGPIDPFDIYDNTVTPADGVTSSNKSGSFYLSTGIFDAKVSADAMTSFAANLQGSGNWSVYTLPSDNYAVDQLIPAVPTLNGSTVTMMNVPEELWKGEGDSYANIRPGEGDLMVSTGDNFDMVLCFTAPAAGNYHIDLAAYADAWNYSSDGVLIRMYKGVDMTFVGELAPAIGAEGMVLPPESFAGNVTLAEGECIYVTFNKKAQNWSDHLHIQKLNIIKLETIDVPVATRGSVTLKSAVFSLQHSVIKLKLAGQGTGSYVALYRASDDTEIARVHLNADQDPFIFSEYVLAVTDFTMYEQVYLKIVDEDAEGFISVDDIRIKGTMVYTPEEIQWSFEEGKSYPFSTSKYVGDRKMVIDRAVDANDPNIPVGQHGTYYLSTLDMADGSFDESWSGELTSRDILVYSPTIELKLAGGAAGGYVALCLSATDEEIAKVSLPEGTGTHVFTEVTLDVPYYIMGTNEAVYLKIKDNGAAAGWNFLYVDDIRFTGVELRNDRMNVVWSFEEGTINPFIHVDGDLGAMIGSRTTEINAPNASINKDGTYYFASNVTADGVNINDAFTGTIRSPKFVLTDPKVSFRIGGGQNAELLYVALYKDDGTLVKKTTSPTSRYILHNITWDLTGLVDETDILYLEVVDNNPGGWGNLLFDDFRFTGYTLRQLPSVTEEQLEELTGWNAEKLDSLRAMVRDLMETYPDEFDRDEEFLTRIDTVQAVMKGIAVQGLLADDPAIADAKAAADALSLEIAKANPLIANKTMLFVSRYNYAGDHHNTHTMFPSYEGEFNIGSYTPGGAVKVMDITSGTVSTLLEDSDGVFRDPDISYDGTKVVFAYRQNSDDSYHIYEGVLNDTLTAFTATNQLTSMANVDDYNPLYMPSGNIVFNSTRDPKYVQCNRHISSNIYRMESDGANIVKITNSTLFEQPTDVAPDGRILYDRWEYVDRDFASAQGIWTVNEDGTQQVIYYGNNTPTGAAVDAKAIPGSGKIVVTLTSTHDRPWGGLAVVNNELGIDGGDPVEYTWPQSLQANIQDPGEGYNVDAYMGLSIKYSDPQPLSEKYYLCTRQIEAGSEKTGIYLIDTFGNEILLYEDAGQMGAYDAMVIQSSEPEMVKTDRRDYKDETGSFFVQNVYEGTGMENVEPGSVKYLRVVQVMEKRTFTALESSNYYANGQQFPGVNFNSFEVKKVLGVVPVYEDGSAYFEVPQDAFVYFQLLDEDGRMIQSMRSGTLVQSGETTGCVGCHEDRRTAPTTGGSKKTPMALEQSFQVIDGVGVNVPDTPSQMDTAESFNYLTEIQPIFDQSCISCHGYDDPAADLTLVGDKTLIFNASYIELWRNRGMNNMYGNYLGAVGAGLSDLYDAKQWGSYASPLVNKLYDQNDAHYAYLTDAQRQKIAEWVDINATYYPDYTSVYPVNPGGHSPLTQAELESIPGGYTLPLNYVNIEALIYFDNPEKSPILKRYEVGSQDYNTVLTLIKLGQQRLAETPDVDMPGYVMNATDAWRYEKVDIFARIESDNRRALLEGRKLYDWDHEKTWPDDPFPGY